VTWSFVSYTDCTLDLLLSGAPLGPGAPSLAPSKECWWLQFLDGSCLEAEVTCGLGFSISCQSVCMMATGFSQNMNGPRDRDGMAEKDPWCSA
jgi:hypothetical protein